MTEKKILYGKQEINEKQEGKALQGKSEWIRMLIMICMLLILIIKRVIKLL